MTGKKKRSPRKIHRRNCVICSTGISTQDPDIWTCSEECTAEIEERKRLNKLEAVELEEIREISAMPVSEAAKARQGLDLLMGSSPSPPVEEPSLSQMAMPTGGSWGEYLDAALGLIKTAQKLSAPADAYLLVEIASGFLDRASQVLHSSVDISDEVKGEEVEVEA